MDTQLAALGTTGYHAVNVLTLLLIFRWGVGGGGKYLEIIYQIVVSKDKYLEYWFCAVTNTLG